MAAIELDHISKKFASFTALSELTLDVQQGEFLTLLGPSGCGKTTLLRLISGFLEPTEGVIRINGADVTQVPPEARDTALCFQSYALFPHLTVRENLEFGLRQKRVPIAERKSRVASVAEKLELIPQLEKLPNQLSGGQQQRVSLGRALVMRPSVILFDEPLSNLDAKLRDQVRVEIRRIQKEYGLTAIYVTHDQAEALAMSDRVVVLNAGKVEQVDTPEFLYAHPKTRFVADFIGSANVFVARLNGISASGLRRIETPIGAFAIAGADALPDGEVNICWRPEKARLGGDGIDAIVINRAFQGQFTEFLVESSGVTYRIQSGSSEAREGDRIRFALSPDDIILLGPDK
jgi:ABC-type Fe3+/spermidine/putrescine transport system ATPase subunit